MFTHHYLLWQFTRREVAARYRGSVLGLGWTLLSPLAMLGAFTLVFYGFFDLKWPQKTTGTGTMDFALQVYAGLIVFNWFAEVAGRGPSLITAQPNLVTRVVFPLPLLAWSAMLAAGFQALVSLALLMAVSTVLVGPALAWLWLPVLILPFGLMLAGMALWLSALGVYLRDIAPLMALLTSLLMFLSPVFYPAETVPEAWRGVYLLNPLAWLITQLRELLYTGQPPALGAWLVMLGLGLALCASGSWLFQRLKGGFADVL